MGYKDIENRNWYTRERGLILIHASKTFDFNGYEFIHANYPSIKMPHIKDFDLGGIMGGADLINCVSRHSSKWFFGASLDFSK